MIRFILRISFLVLMFCTVATCAIGQTLLCRMQRFHKDIPPGNYSGITPIGGNRFAVVSDKADTDGFYIFHIEIDTVHNRIMSIKNEGYRSSGERNRDMEGITYHPFFNTLFISGEKDNEVYEYSLDGKRTGRRLLIPDSFKKASSNRGLESLTYDRASRRFYTATEKPLPGDSLLVIQAFDDNLALTRQYLYRLDPPIHAKCIDGVAELCALDDGSLLVLERQLRIPKLKIGSKAVVRLYRVFPEGQIFLEKHLVAEFTTRLNLLRKNFANFEGACVPALGWVMLVADSQNRHNGIIRDWFRLVKMR